MRTFEKTHPWIKFQIDLKTAPAELWIQLGECQSKCEHVSGVPLNVELDKKLHQVYLAKGVLATTAIEGNTLSEDEVQAQLEGRLELPPSREYLRQEVQNIIDECNQVAQAIKSGVQPVLSPERVQEVNRAVLKNLSLPEEVAPGEYRRHSVTVGHYRGAPYQDCAYLMERYSQWLNSATFQTDKNDLKIVYAIIQAVMAHLYMAWIHPFGDGNGRTARLLEFQILISSGVPSPAAHLLSNHYNQTRSDYYLHLTRSSKAADVMPFLRYAVQGFLDGLRTQLSEIRKMQQDLIWENYVYEEFRHKKTKADQRRRNLVLAVTKAGKPVAIPDLPLLSPTLAREYATEHVKKLSRDLNQIFQMGLLKKEGNKVRACQEIILAFLPLQTPAGDSCRQTRP